MFNDYAVFQLMKLRQEETERNARDAWKYYVSNSRDAKVKETVSPTNQPIQCCPCTCA